MGTRAAGALGAPTQSRASRRALGLVAGAAVASLALSGCSLGTVGQLGVHAGVSGTASSAAIHVTPSPDKTVAPGKPVVVSVAGGRLTDVVVAGPDGAAVPGRLSLDGRTWTSSTGALDYNAAYTVSAAAVDRTGLPTDLKATLRTIAPTTFLGYSMDPAPGTQVGVGMPVTLTLDRHLTSPSSQAMLERHLVVTANGAPVIGGWNWITDKVLEYRPMTYWPGHATIAVTANVKGVRFDHGLWGKDNAVTTFKTGPAMISYVDMVSDHMKVTKDGKVVRIIPITSGKPGFETRSGIKVIMTKERTRIMDAATGGTAKTDPEYYRLEVQYAMRLTWSGEFLHAAPWSVWAQGSQNVSHGCTGMSLDNAAWMYDQSEIGDVVVYTGTDKPMNSGNGITVWNYSWDRWKSFSALNA